MLRKRASQFDTQWDNHLPAFQKIGVDVPCTERGNKYVVVFQEMLTKWPMVYAVPG